MNSEPVEAKVARGAAWLDAHRRGWERTIDLATLDVAIPWQCPIGQVFREAAEQAGFADGFGFNFGLLQDVAVGDDPAAYGFDATGPCTMEERNWRYDELDEAWRELLKERFDSGLLSDEVDA